MSFAINGMPVPSPQLGNIYEWNRVSISYNDMNGTFQDKTIAQKDKFLWEYEFILYDDFIKIEELTKGRINEGAKRNTFDVTSWTPDRGFVTKRCYLGTPIGYRVLASNKGLPTVLAVSYHWIQITGNPKLNTGLN